MLAQVTRLGQLPAVTAADAFGDLVLLADSRGQLHVFHLSSGSTEVATRLVGVCTAVRLSPSGIYRALGLADGWVRVFSLTSLLADDPRPSESFASHRQHGASRIEHLCWSADSSKVYSGCGGGLVVEMLLSPPPPAAESALVHLQQLSSKLGVWVPSSEVGTTIVCHHPGERTLQLSSCLSETSSGASDMCGNGSVSVKAANLPF